MRMCVRSLCVLHIFPPIHTMKLGGNYSIWNQIHPAQWGRYVKTCSGLISNLSDTVGACARTEPRLRKENENRSSLTLLLNQYVVGVSVGLMVGDSYTN